MKRTALRSTTTTSCGGSRSWGHERRMNDPNPYAAPASTAAHLPGSPRGRLLPFAIALLVLSILHIFGALFYFTYVYSVVSEPDADPQSTHALVVYSMYYGISVLYCLLLAF